MREDEAKVHLEGRVSDVLGRKRLLKGKIEAYLGDEKRKNISKSMEKKVLNRKENSKSTKQREGGDLGKEEGGFEQLQE